MIDDTVVIPSHQVRDAGAPVPAAGREPHRCRKEPKKALSSKKKMS